MPRYIDADALIAELNERAEAAVKWGVNAIADRREDIKIKAEQAIATFCEVSLTVKKLPTADVVPVVRCKECKHRDADDFCTGRGYPNGLVPDDGFCDKGERIEDEGFC